MTGFMTKQSFKEKQKPQPGYLRITGDIHGHVRTYADSVSECQYSIQIGDLGFGYEGMKRLSHKNHKFFGGNHDNYDIYNQSMHSLGDYGKFSLGGFNLYFIRGASSIDKVARIKAERRGSNKCWWSEEELNLQQMYEAFEDYKSVRPKVMMSHTCPNDVAKLVGNPNVLRMFGFNPDTYSEPTHELLQNCFDAYKPDIWIFGHFHRSWTYKYKGTIFICLAENEHIDVDEAGVIKNKYFTGRI